MKICGNLEEYAVNIRLDSIDGGGMEEVKTYQCLGVDI